MEWVFKKFEELTTAELYAILRLRNEVFVVEQNCVYQDLDNKDQLSWHVMCWKEQELVAYTRIIPPGSIYPEARIGRVVTAQTHRNTGLGRELMNRTLKHCESIFSNADIALSAQVYLKDFYVSLGFHPEGEVYPEDGIEHIHMKRNTAK